MSDVAINEDRAEPGYADAGDFFALLKPRVMSLVIFTSIVGLLLAPGAMPAAVAVTAILCIAVGAGASGALNMWYDADIDAQMTRTAKRPVPSGAVTPQEALGFGLTLSAGSVIMMGLGVNLVAAGMLAFTIFFYAVIYTMWLKRSTAQNIVIGGAAGAFPPMIGWAAVTGGVSMESIVLFAIIFLWTPPHFWALSLWTAKQYERVGVPMLPVVAGEKETRRQILIYTVPMIASTLAPVALGFAGLAYGLFAAILGAGFGILSWRLWRAPDADAAIPVAKRTFGYSIFYLFALYAALLIEGIADKLG